MMTEDFITRAEHQAAIDRLDRADQDLAKQITETERQLRTEFVASVEASEGRISHRIDGVDAHLTLQDQYIIGRKIDWKKTIVGALIGAASMVAAYAVLHFGLHIG